MLNSWLLASALCALFGIWLLLNASSTRKNEIIERRLSAERLPLKGISGVVTSTNLKRPKLKVDFQNLDALFQAVLANWIKNEGWVNRIPYSFKICAGILGAICSVFSTWVVWPLLDMSVYGPLSCAVGFTAGYLFLQTGADQYQRKRRNQFEQHAPDIIDFFVLAVEAGTSFDRAVTEITPLLAPVYPEMAQQLAHLSQDLVVLPTREKAFENLEKRTGSVTFCNLKSYLIQSEKYGTPVAHALKQVAIEARKLSLALQQEKARKLPVFISIPLMLMILPPIVVVSTGPGFVQLMRTF